MEAGTEPADSRIQPLMARWSELRRVFIDDDSDIRAGAGRAWQAMWDQHPDQLRGSSRVAPPEMWDYIQRAESAHDTG